jgi:ubiquinone/menaquinone biosynthesis C-methylase UbiE
MHSAPVDFDQLPVREGYDRWAAIYDDEDNPLVAIEQPQIDALLGEVRGLTVADIGCGTGRHALRLAKAGARVTALDFSRQMLSRARAKPGAESINFIQHDLAHPLPLDSGTFDRVLCSLVLDHIANLDFLFAELKRICRPAPGGAIVISIMHPAMMLRGIQARFTDPSTGRETRPESCPHQISDYVMAAASGGLSFDHMSEHRADESLAARCPRAAKYVGWPLLLMFRLRSI